MKTDLYIDIPESLCLYLKLTHHKSTILQFLIRKEKILSLGGDPTTPQTVEIPKLLLWVYPFLLGIIKFLYASAKTESHL